MTRLERLRRRQAWINFIGNQEPEFFVTLTFKRSYSDRTAIGAADHFVRRLQKSLPTSHRGHLRGVVAGERHIRPSLEGSLHFHMLLWNLPESSQFNDEWLRKKAWAAAEALRGPRGGRMCRSGKTNVDVQTVHCEEGVARYVSKEISRFHYPAGEQLWFVLSRGMEGYLLPNVPVQ